MFEWLVAEMGAVMTPKFFLVDGPATAELREAVENSDFPLPPSYKEFVLRFGNAKFYRSLSYYHVNVLAGPRIADNFEGERLIQFGGTSSSSAYFKESLLVEGSDAPVFEWYGPGGFRKTADGFEEWLKAKCKAARKRYKAKEWESIQHGPTPFTEYETGVVEARRKFKWRVVGVSNTGCIQFEVYNGSDAILPFLSIGIRGKRRETDAILEGGIWLPVGSVLPGQTKTIEKDCYQKWVDPQDVVAFAEPDPEPEDRDRYWEFRPLDGQRE